jgi:hypothetical protein
MHFYHVTPIKNVKSILSNGLKSSGNSIFFIDTDELFIIKNIAFSQIFCREIAVLKISPEGINEDILHDNVAEFASANQFYTKQNLIKPEFIEIHKEYTFTLDDNIDFQVQCMEMMGFKINRSDIVFIPPDQLRCNQ